MKFNVEKTEHIKELNLSVAKEIMYDYVMLPYNIIHIKLKKQ